MAESKATVPDFSIADRRRHGRPRARCAPSSRPPPPTAQPVPSFNDMVVKACALALREHPRANGSYRDGRFELYSPRERRRRGRRRRTRWSSRPSSTPTRKSLGEIARKTRALAERVRDSTITPAELAGGTFTVSNLGMYGVTHFTAVINPPQAAILAVGAITERRSSATARSSSATSMTITLACDHRILYGADAAQFLARVRELLESPLALAF